MTPRVGFVLEQTLGHIAHSANLQHLVGSDPSIDAVFAPIEFAVEGVPSHVPGFGNWTVRAGVRARRSIRAMRRDGRVDALFVHTQVPAILCPDLIRRIPTVVSLDATPIQYDELGELYGHRRSVRVAERLKWRANRSCFHAAAAVVAWSAWTKQGLIERYDVPEQMVHVIPPGVDVDRWSAIGAGRQDRPHDGTTRVLFVGGDFARKGGPVLVDAVSRLRRDGAAVELDVVTRDDVAAPDGIRVHHGLEPNSSALIDLYHRADVFCLPTLADCLPMVLSEAGAVGLPLVATDVGAISEIVRDGVTGRLAPVDDARALADVIGDLAGDEQERRRLGEGARRLIDAEFSAARNARRLVSLLTGAPHRAVRPGLTPRV